MSNRSHNKSTVSSHLRHAAGEVVAALAAVLGDVGCEEFLETGERAGGEHLGAEGVLLQGCEVGLHCG